MDYLLISTAAISITVFLAWILKACIAALRTRHQRAWSPSKPSHFSPAMDAIVPIAALAISVLTAVARETGSILLALLLAAVCIAVVGSIYVGTTRGVGSVRRSVDSTAKRPSARAVDTEAQFQAAHDDFVVDEKVDPYGLTGQARQILETLAPLVRDRSLADGVDPEDRIDQAKEFLGNLPCALAPPFGSHPATGS